MDFGAMMFSTDYSIRPDDLAKMLEDRGFESMWVPEHTHIPADRTSPWPGGPDLPKDYWHTYDPFVALTAAASVTTDLKLGTGICLMIERDPITTAKEIASLDMLSRGRFIFGIGGGWNAEEMRDHGTNFKRRWRILRENILAMKEIWTQEEAEFHGDHVNFDKMWAYPKPVQRPHPPILMGGDGPTTFDRVIDYCDGWIPIGSRSSGGPSLAEKIVLLKRQAEDAGRDPDSLNITNFGIRPDPELIARLDEAGVDRVIFTLPSQEQDEVTPLIDECAKLIS
ncbi:MAG: LLM class F420-dependent oxidoreductase [SAR202 cluster bacterium]|mgnify:FL=1|nr:LLM class F420-dependent oxidoreductase [SAR202 cluster bacterium]|tara:strand:- start:25 stop:870 length:846 start_codon:yes stop_codon:yes gene_type:complete